MANDLLRFKSTKSMWIPALFISFKFADELRNTLDKIPLRFMRMKSSDLEISTFTRNWKILRIDIRKWFCLNQIILTWFKSRSGHFEAHSSCRLAGAAGSSKSSGRSAETLPAIANTFRNAHNPVANIISTTPRWNEPSITLHGIFAAISLTVDRHCSPDPPRP